MKAVIVTALLLSTAAAIPVFAQDGQGHGPPHGSPVVFLAQTAAPAQTQTLKELFVPKSALSTLQK